MKTILKGTVVVLAVIAITASVFSQAAVLTWVQSWGVYNLFVVGSSTAGASFVAKADSVRFGKAITLNDKVTAGGTAFALIDSFATTGATDTVTVSGATSGDVFVVSPYTPLHSPVPDTGSCQYSARFVSANTVVVSRTKLTAASTLKSAAGYYLITVNK